MKTRFRGLCLLGLLILAASVLKAQSQDIEIVTSNKMLETTFNWAKTKAQSYVMTGRRGVLNKSEYSAGDGEATYMPCYWAGYPHRTAFYSRDYCHQMAGAHLLGLDRENLEMLRAFAKSANSDRKWYPLWAINFDGSCYKLDYRNDQNFVREVPATFELVEKAYKQLLWTGNKNLLTDSILWNYYTKVVTEFIALHDSKIPNGIAEGDGSGSIFKGVATYNEDHKLSYVEAADGVACQYQALLAYSKMLEIKGEKTEAEKYLKRANEIKQIFNKEWYLNNDQVFSRGRTKDGTYLDGFGRETSFFVLLKQIADNGEKCEKYADFVAKSLNVEYQAPVNIESISYLPDFFFPYNRIEDGWKWTKTIINRLNDKHVVEEAGLNSDYPEISYTFISNIVENMMGVEPDAVNDKISTVSRLPKEVSTLGINGLKIGKHKINLLHEGRNRTTISHLSGNRNLLCEFRFYGHFNVIYINGKPKKAVYSTLNGVEISSVQVPVAKGKKVVAEVKS